MTCWDIAAHMSAFVAPKALREPRVLSYGEKNMACCTYKARIWRQTVTEGCDFGTELHNLRRCADFGIGLFVFRYRRSVSSIMRKYCFVSLQPIALVQSLIQRCRLEPLRRTRCEDAK
ncbi:hypothetical protein KCV07_g309, partial [Aureobasidium melanogenum]